MREGVLVCTLLEMTAAELWLSSLHLVVNTAPFLSATQGVLNANVSNVESAGFALVYLQTNSIYGGHNTVGWYV